MAEKNRCKWAQSDALLIEYHDNEWGVPIYDDRLLFELLNLEGAQAGLSWSTVLKKRENYRALFDNFDPIKIAKYRPNKIESLLKNAGIIRNRLKVESTIINAKAYLNLLKEWDSFNNYLWHFVENKPIQNSWDDFKNIPTKTSISDQLSKDLKKRGFKFVGSTICYAFMQAVGMVNDHTVDCFCYKKIARKNLKRNICAPILF